tara:strand:- start:995 stop:1915 length:921 start_codon:yes stop_codon:yes gene_type:complete
MLHIKLANPMHTIQDLGRFGFVSQGVAQAGPMDSVAACWANQLLRNPVNCPIIEIGGGGFVAEFIEDVNFAVTGAWGDISLNGDSLSGPGAYPAPAGSELRVGRLDGGMFTYLAVDAGFEIHPILGSVATCQRDLLGGLHKTGTSLSVGEELSYKKARLLDHRLMPRRFLESYTIPLECEIILRSSDNFEPAAFKQFLHQSYTVSQEQSRMGYRLHGHSIINAGNPRYSVPMTLGGVQIPPSGQPVVLMRDHQSLGGYPLIGTVARKSLGQLAQRKAGQQVSFRAVSSDEARVNFMKYQKFFGDFR